MQPDANTGTRLLRGTLIIAALLFASPPHPAAARSTGITGVSGKQGPICNQQACHGDGTAPLVRFEGPAQVVPGAMATFRFVVESQSPLQTYAGFNVAATAGQLAIIAGEGAQQLGDELTHTAPKMNVNGVASWDFTWKAPDTVGVQTLFGAGNSVNHNGNASGDRASATTAPVIVALDSATPTPTPLVGCVGDCNGDQSVTINELITGVNIALDSLPLNSCPAFDANGDGAVTIDELLKAVNAALNSCPL